MNRRAGSGELVELLMVLGVLVLAIAIAASAVRSCNAKGPHKTHCGTNLKNIYTAMKLYAGANERYFPTVYSGLDGETWRDRKSVVLGKSVDYGGRGIVKK